VGLIARYLPIDHDLVLVLAAASPYLMLAGPIGMLLLALGRRWLLTLLAALLCMVLIAVQAPRYLGPEKGAVPAAAVRVLTANLGLGQADPRAVVALARDSADVLAIQEMTPEAAAGLSAAGLDAMFPHRIIDPHELAGGIGIWSRYPIVESGPIGGFSLSMLRARVQVPGVVTDPTVVAVHLAAPWVQPIDYWRQDISRFPDTLRELARAAGAGAVIVAGDFNSTADMLPFRRLLGEGYRDAAEQAGAGMTRTYPSRRWRPPMIGIDHVLVYNSVAMSARTVVLPGSDHRGLVATVEVPLDPTAS
jgi:endonuclease/exonuclease/phosphatase (EEP) superfamily protein YafD